MPPAQKRALSVVSLLIACSTQSVWADDPVVHQPLAPTAGGEFSNLGPSNQQVADDFSVMQQTTLTSLSWQGRYWGAASPPDPVDFSIRFYTTIGETVTVSPLQEVDVSVDAFPTGLMFDSTPWLQYTASLPGLTIDPGRYWVSVVETDPRTPMAGSSQWLWADALTGGARACRSNDAEAWTVGTDVDHAFTINGTVQAAQTEGVFLSEPFNYQAGARLDSSVWMNGRGLAGQWGETPYDEESRVEAGSLTAPAGYGYGPSANCVGMPVGQGRSFAVACPSPANQAALGSESFFFSFLFRKAPDADVGLAFGKEMGVLVYQFQFNYASPTNTQYQMLIQGGGHESKAGLAALADGHDYLVVGKATNDPIGDDKLEVIFYDAATDVVPSSEPSSFFDSIGGIDIGTPLVCGISVQINGEGRFDELVVGTTWESVIGVPEPGTLAILALGGLALLRRRRVRA